MHIFACENSGVGDKYPLHRDAASTPGTQRKDLMTPSFTIPLHGGALHAHTEEADESVVLSIINGSVIARSKMDVGSLRALSTFLAEQATAIEANRNPTTPTELPS